MFARLAKFSDARRRHPMPVQATHAYCNDNHRPDPRVAAASQRAKRQGTPWPPASFLCALSSSQRKACDD
jgi:hypothetical protein